MRQQSESHPQSNSGYTTQSNEARKQRMDKKRAIRKNRIGYVSEQPLETKQDKSFLSKEQKMQLQKAKNRQAAQKSRDQHKRYVETLQEEIQNLKQQLSKPRYCNKCSKCIVSDTGDSSDPSSLQFENQGNLQAFIQNQNIHELEDFESPFVRMHDYEQSSPLKMFLFISMIMLGVFLLTGSAGSDVEGATVKRDLQEINNQNNGHVIQIDQVQIRRANYKQIQQIKKFDLMNEIENTFNMEDQAEDDQIMTQVVPLSYELSPLSRQNCLKSIIDKNYTVQALQKPLPKMMQKPGSLRAGRNYDISRNSYQMQIFSPQHQENNHNILFCSMPKLYRKSEQTNSGFLSKFIDIILSGSQMMEIIGNSPNLWMNKMINFNGIYKINAEVREVVQIKDGNCIL